ncbi:hypothetical protein MBH78_12770 [Oceanimonas sp. NS1]|nr:hypothetical protein [Oceanimonas sp. NS1]
MAQSREVMMGILTIVVASVLWGTTGTVASFAENVSALATGAFAMGVGGILLALNAGKALRKDRAKLWASPGALALGGCRWRRIRWRFTAPCNWPGLPLAP